MVKNPELVYCAIPSRMESLSQEIEEYVMHEGKAPFNPLRAFPRQYFEDNCCIGRKRTLVFCKRAIQMCDAFYLFGISQGTSIVELPYARKLKKPITPVTLFDEHWNNYAQELNLPQLKLD